ncbi:MULTISPECIES: hypothetical protein [Halorussus]|uniref:Envelope protein N-terminal domain-containing protein n=2 Tax=Halorussus TaxID=1070314 RepID=A0A8U0HU10_9EURY|nr:MULTISPECIES: hypothetical protein [Halorussus]UPV74572.1 hypothetical protein M0R89_00540 [Halorussus limi]
MVVAVFSAGQINEDKCGDNHVDHVIEDMQESDANQTKTDIYSAASGQKAQTQNSLTVMDNYLNDTESVAWMHAEKAIAKAYKNGKSKAEAKIAAKEAIEDYYAVKQRNLIETWNVSLTAADTLRQRAVMEEKVPDDYVYTATESRDDATTSVDSTNYTSTQITLVNETSHNVSSLRMNMSGYSTPAIVTVSGMTQKPSYNSLYVGTFESEGNFDGSQVYLQGIAVAPPSSDYSRLQYLEFQQFETRWNKLGSKASSLQSEVDPYVDSTWDAYQEDRINASDVMSRTTLMFEQGVDAKNSSGMYNTVAGLAAMGLETPNLNESGYMTVQMDGQTYEGLLLADNPPNGTWETNTTYTASNFSGPVNLATLDGGLKTVEGEFVIQNMTDKSGDEIQSIQTREYVYKTSDASGLLEKMEDMQTLRMEIEEREPTAGGGSSSGTGLDNVSMKQIGAILAILGGLALISSRGKN